MPEGFFNMAGIDESSNSQKWFEDNTFTGVVKLANLADACNGRLSAVSQSMQDVLSLRSQHVTKAMEQHSCPQPPREPLAEWNKDEECRETSKAELRALRRQESEKKSLKSWRTMQENPEYSLANLIDAVRRTCSKDVASIISPAPPEESAGSAEMGSGSGKLAAEPDNEHVVKPKQPRRYALNKRAAVISNSLRAAFVRSTAPVRQMESSRQPSVTEYQMYRLADDLHYHPQEVMYVKKIFDKMDLNNDESLSVHELHKGVCHLLIGTKFSEYLVRRTCRAFWSLERDGDIGFQEFFNWFAKHNFRDPDQEAAYLEEQARQYQITEEGMRQVKMMFDSVDVDKSGDIQIEEFKLLLAKLLHIPRGIEMPPGHIHRLWSELDTSGDDKVTLQEFLPWWVEKQSRFIPYENIYANVRNLGKMKPDPPAYPKGPSDSPDDGAELQPATWRRHRS